MNEELLEIKLPYGKWVKVSPYIFRSWTGERRRDGKPYNGPVFILGTFYPATKARKA